MYVMSSVRIFVLGWVGPGMDLAWGAQMSINGLLSGPGKHALQAILYQTHCKYKGYHLCSFP